MPGRRGTARRSPTLRRIKRVKEKYVVSATVRRFKVLNLQPTDPMPEELEFELTILDWLEQRIFAHMRNMAVPSDQWTWYVGFAKRLWERAVKFAQATFQLEKTSLVNEYTLRGNDPTVLGEIQIEAEAMATLKRGELLPPGWAYDDTVGAIYIQEWGAYDDLTPGTAYICEPQGNVYPNCGGSYDDRE